MASPEVKLRPLELEKGAPVLEHDKKRREDDRVVDIYTTGDKHLTFSITRSADNKPAEVSRLQGFHYLVEGDAQDITIAGSDDPVHGQSHIVELKGRMESSHLGAVDVFDARTKTPLTPEGQPRSRRMRIDNDR